MRFARNESSIIGLTQNESKKEACMKKAKNLTSCLKFATLSYTGNAGFFNPLISQPIH